MHVSCDSRGQPICSCTLSRALRHWNAWLGLGRGLSLVAGVCVSAVSCVWCWTAECAEVAVSIAHPHHQVSRCHACVYMCTYGGPVPTRKCHLDKAVPWFYPISHGQVKMLRNHEFLKLWCAWQMLVSRCWLSPGTIWPCEQWSRQQIALLSPLPALSRKRYGPLLSLAEITRHVNSVQTPDVATELSCLSWLI